MPQVDTVDGMAFGVGVDLAGQIFGDAVVRTEPEVVGGAQTTDIFLTLVNSQEDQDRALDLSTEVSAAYGLFGGSAKFNLSQKMHFHQFATTLIIRAAVLNPFRQMRDVKLRENGPTALLGDGHGDRFREQFGDFFVRGMRTGGQFCAILQIVGKDRDDQSDVKATLEASGILGAVAVNTADSFRTVVHNATINRETKLRHIQIGGTQTASLDPEEMVAHALRFASEVGEGSSEAVSALVVPYKTLDLPEGPNLVDIMAAKQTLELLMTTRRDAFERLTAFDFVATHPEQFNFPRGMNVNAIVGRLNIAVVKLTSAASLCVNHPSQSGQALESIADLDIPLDELPKRRGGALTPPEPVRLPTKVPDFMTCLSWAECERLATDSRVVASGILVGMSTHWKVAGVDPPVDSPVFEGDRVTIAYKGDVHLGGIHS